MHHVVLVWSHHLTFLHVVYVGRELGEIKTVERASRKSDRAAVYITSFAAENCDYLPDENTQVQMPYHLQSMFPQPYPTIV